MASNTDFFPARDTELANWADNYKAKIATHGPTIGRGNPDILQQQGFCQDIIAQVTAVEQAKADFHNITATKKNVVKDRKDKLRTVINQEKQDPGFTEAIGKALDVFTKEGTFDPDTFKPGLKATVFPGHVRLNADKDQTDGTNFYARLKGAGQWTHLGRDNFPPYDDTRPLAVASVPETREYMAIGLLHDHEIGLPSDIVSAVFGG